MPWYIFIGSATAALLDPCDPNQYILYDDDSPPVCIGTDVLCAIQANDNKGTPVITYSLCGEINRAVIRNTPSTNVLLEYWGL